jgi:uncharacterized protein (TIGR03437 family)
LVGPEGIAADGAGNLFIADTGDNRIRKVTPAGTISTVAGNGTSGFGGDGGPATSAELNNPISVAVDVAGNLFIADFENNRIRKVTPAGTISTVAGNGIQGFGGDGGPATSAELNYPGDVAVDGAGNLFIVDWGNNRIRKVTPAGAISTVAGNGTAGFSGDGGPATSAEMWGPEGVAADGAGNVFFADSGNDRIRRVTPAGTISTVAGNGVQGFSGDGGPATSAELWGPYGVAVDSAGNLFIADLYNNRVRRVTPASMIGTVAGNGTAGFSGDGAPATSAELNYPIGVAVDGAGNLFIVDSNQRVRKVALTQSGAAVLAISKTHSGSFTQGQTGATYTVTVSNAGSSATSGTATVTDTIPSGLALVSMSGTGWSCTSNTCTRSDALNSGSSYPPIIVTVNVAPNAASQVTNQVGVAGGGSVSAGGSDVTQIAAGLPAPVLTSPGDGSTGVSLAATLTWTASNGATSYDVFFGASSSPNLVTNITGTSYSPGALSPSTLYYWRIVARSAAASNSSPTWSFVTQESASTGQEWAHTWGGNKTDSIASVATDATGNVYLAGSTSSYGAGGQDVLLLKYDSTGRLLWSRVWGGPADDNGNGVAVDSSGNVYVVGATQSFGLGWADALLLKFDGSGNLLWSKTWGGSSFDVGYDAAFDSAGNVYVAAESYSLGNCAVLLKFDSNGNLLSSHTWKGPATYDSGYSVDVDKSGNVVLAGVSWDYSVSPNHDSVLVLKFDSQGNFLWNRNLVSGAEDQAGGAKTVRFDASGNIFIAGYRAAVCQDSDFSKCNFDVELAKLDSNGNLAWARSWGGPGFESVGGVALDQSENLVVSGSTQSFLGGTSAAMILSFDPSGNLLKSRIWGEASAVSGSGVTTDSTGAAILAGSASNASGSWQDVSGSSSSLSPSLTTPSGHTGTSTGGLGTPAGSLASPTGVTDSGGSGQHALVVRTTLSQTAPPNVQLSVSPSSLLFTMLGSGALPSAQNLSVSSGGSTLSFTATASTTSGGNWLILGSTTGATPATLAVSISPTISLAAGTYNGMVTVTANGASNGPQTTTVTLTITPSPVLTVKETHSGVFSQGQAGSYTIAITNSAAGGPTNGTVSVADALPTGLGLASIAGPGWSCVGAACTRSDALAPGSSYPSITLNVNVALNAPSQVTNQVTVSGGGSAAATATDVTNIAAVTGKIATTVTVTASPSSIATTASTTLTATVTAASGGGTPTGTIAFDLGSTVLGSATLTGTGGTAQANLAVNGSNLALGSDSVTANYSGDANYNGSAASVAVTVTSSQAGGTFLQLTSATSRDWFPVWRPDGTKILFSSNRTNLAVANDVWDMNPDGSQQRELVHVDITTPSSWGDPGLAANTKEFIGSTDDLAVIKEQDYWEVMRVALSSATSFPIVRTVWNGADTFFSDLLLVPGGLGTCSFVYSGATQNAAWIDCDSGQQQVRIAPFSQLSGQSSEAIGTVLLTTSSDGAQGGLAFAPNGLQLVASLCITSCSALHKGTDVYVLDATTGQAVQRVTTDGDAGISAIQPRWSPDGQWIAFVSNKSGHDEIWMVHPDGTGAKQVTTNGLDNSGPSWSPDSKSLAFATNNNGSYSIWLASLQPSAASPALSIAVSHGGTFTQGQTGAVFSVTVSNAASGGPTSGAITVVDNVPTGLTLVSMTGSGWACSGGTCTRSDVLNVGSSYPPITVTVNVASNAPTQVTNQATVSGGGSALAAASDMTAITASTALSISSNGVANAASYATGAVAPGSIAAVFGSFPVTSPATTPGAPWPTGLGGLSMQFGTVQAPLNYVSGTQVNLQVPWELAGRTQATITAAANGQSSAAQTVNLAPFAPGIFATNGQGSGQGAILDQSGKLVDTSNPATAGSSYVSIYCTGLGPVSNQPATGAASPTNPPAATTTTPTVTIGGAPAQVLFSGLAPGFVGEYQVNVQVPAGAVPGNAVPVAISIGGAVSNTVTMAVNSAPAGTLTSINPGSSAAGKILTVVITAVNTNFAQGQTLASFGPGISVGGGPLGQLGVLTVTGPTSATAQVTIDPSAALGARTVTVTTGTQTASLNNAFTVLAPPAPLGPLSVASTLPANGDINVSMTPSIRITFNEPLDPATINSSTFTLANTRTSLPATVTMDSTGTIVTVTPSGVLTPNGTYSVTIGSQVRNAAEGPLGNPLTFSFTVVPPATVNGSVTAPAGLDPTSLRVLSFGGNVTAPSSSGGFSASVSPLGTGIIAAMLPGKAFGFLAVTAAGAPANPSATGDSAAHINTVVGRVHNTRWQVTASPAAASSPDNLVVDFQTTAEALVFATPYLFTKDPQKAQVILSAIASNPATAQLAQTLAQSWNEADPMGDSLVQSAFQNAVLAVVQALGQQSQAQSGGPSVAQPEASATAAASSSPATVTVTPYCWPGLTSSTPGLPCLDLDYLNFQGSTSVDANTGNYGLSPQNCFQKLGGCAVSWLARITPIGVDPNSIVAKSDSFGPESPIVAGELAACASTSPPSCAAWIAGNSAFASLDIMQDVITGASVEWQQLGLPNLFTTGPSFVLPAGANQASYIVRAYSGGLADIDEAQNVWNSKYPDALQLGSAALGINLIQEVVDFINFSTLGLPKTAGVETFFTCELTDLVTDFVAGASVEANATTSSEILGNYKTILTSAMGQTLSCAADAGLQALIKLLGEAGAALSGIGTAFDVVSQIGSAGSSGGDAIQRIYDLGFWASAVETAVINVAPGSAAVGNPIPSITSLSPTSATAGSAPLPLTISGKYLLSNSVVTFKGTSHQAALTSTGDLTITLSVTDLATPGTFGIVVTNPTPGGGASNAVNFTVQPSSQNPQPAIASLSPSSASAGSSPLILTVNGSGFSASSTVTFNGVSHAASFVNASQLTISLSASDLATPGSFPVVVTNPPPGGGASNSAAFMVNGSASGVSISPSSVSVPEGAVQTFAATVSGAGTVAWSVLEGAKGGTVTSTGIYTAPNSTGTFHVVATSNASPAQTATATVTVTAASSYAMLHSFSGGFESAPLVQGTDGNYYGTTEMVAFKIDPSGNFTQLSQLSSSPDAPISPLIQASDGNFYGTTSEGGASGLGSIFRIDASGNVTVMSSFAYTYPGATGGAWPWAGLIQGRDGNFYGTTYSGGRISCTPYGFGVPAYGPYGYGNYIQESGCGTVFRMDPHGNVSVLHAFAGQADGSFPQAPLIQASDGNFYGTTSAGGANGFGTVFRMDSSGNLTTLHSFSGPDGNGPAAPLVQASDGSLYGTVPWISQEQNGQPVSLQNACVTCPPGTGGGVFKIDTSGSFTLMHSFSGPDGAFPVAPLVQGSDGNFYGTTWAGGDLTCGSPYWTSDYPYPRQGGCGTVFKMDPSGNVTVLHAFAQPPSDGAAPYAGLLLGKDGQLYGTTFFGGTSVSFGTVFRLSVPGSSQPAITGLSPSSATTGSGPTTLTINGSGFAASCSVTFNGVSHAVAFISSNQLNITLSASDLAAPGTFPVVVTNPGGAASNAISFTVGSGNLSLQGKSFGINGTITLSGKALSFEIATIASGSSSYLVELDNSFSASSGISFEDSFTGTASFSGNTAVFSGTNAAGAAFYSDINTNSGMPISITSTTLTINFTSSATGSAVTGSVKFSTSSGTIQGTFTGTLASPGLF